MSFTFKRGAYIVRNFTSSLAFTHQMETLYEQYSAVCSLLAVSESHGLYFVCCVVTAHVQAWTQFSTLCPGRGSEKTWIDLCVNPGDRRNLAGGGTGWREAWHAGKRLFTAGGPECEPIHIIYRSVKLYPLTVSISLLIRDAGHLYILYRSGHCFKSSNEVTRQSTKAQAYIKYHSVANGARMLHSRCIQRDFRLLAIQIKSKQHTATCLWKP